MTFLPATLAGVLVSLIVFLGVLAPSRLYAAALWATSGGESLGTAIITVLGGSIPLFVTYLQWRTTQAQKSSDNSRAVQIAQLTAERDFLAAERDRERTRAEKAEARAEKAEARANEAEDRAERLAWELGGSRGKS